MNFQKTNSGFRHYLDHLVDKTGVQKKISIYPSEFAKNRKPILDLNQTVCKADSASKGIPRGMHTGNPVFRAQYIKRNFEAPGFLHFFDHLVDRLVFHRNPVDMFPAGRKLKKNRNSIPDLSQMVPVFH